MNCVLPAARVEDDEGAAVLSEGGLDRQVCEPALLSTRYHPHLDAQPLLEPGDDVCSVRRHPQPGGPDRGNRQHAVLSRFLDHPGDRIRGPVHGLGRDRPTFTEALAEAGDLGSIDDGSPGPIVGPFREMKLDRVGPNIDDGIATRGVVDDRPEASGIVGVAVALETGQFDSGDHRLGILRLDRDRAHGFALDKQVGDLGRAPTDHVPSPPFLHGDRTDRRFGTQFLQ